MKYFGIVIIFIISGWWRIEPYDPDEFLYILLEDPELQEQTINNTTRWSYTFVVKEIQYPPEEKVVRWAEVKVRVKSRTGSILCEATNISENDPSSYDDDEDGKVNVEFWFIDSTQDRIYMNEGDTIRITGMLKIFEGCTVEIIWSDGGRIGQIIFPDVFG